MQANWVPGAPAGLTPHRQDRGLDLDGQDSPQSTGASGILRDPDSHRSHAAACEGTCSPNSGGRLIGPPKSHGIRACTVRLDGGAKKGNSHPVSRILYRISGGGGHLSGTRVSAGLELPTLESIAAGNRSSTIRHRSGWGLPSRPVTGPLVVSYTTVSAQPVRPLHTSFWSNTCSGAAGLFFSVALSVGSPRLGVTQHPALWSPDFPRRQKPPRPPG